MEVLTYKCPTCSAPLLYDVETSCWKCKYCNNEFMVKLEYSSVSKKVTDSNSDKMMEGVEYLCSSCGSKIFTNNDTISTFCTYCGSSSIIKNRVVDELKPDGIIPFKITEDEVREKLKKIMAGGLLSRLNGEKNIKVSGIYVPFWLFDCEVIGSSLGRKLPEGFLDDIKYWKKSYYTGSAIFKNIPIDSATKIDDTLMDAIGMFDYNEIRPFMPSYLSGFFTEKYDLEPHEVFERAEIRIKNTFEEALIEKMDKKNISPGGEVETFLNVTDCKYVLLPIWFIDIEDKKKKWHLAMNGQTGDMVGEFSEGAMLKKVLRVVNIFMIAFIITSAVMLGLFYDYFDDTIFVISFFISFLVAIISSVVIFIEEESANEPTNFRKYMKIFK